MKQLLIKPMKLIIMNRQTYKIPIGIFIYNYKLKQTDQ